MARIEILPFADEHIDDAARLLAARHRAQRFVEPGLAATYEEPEGTREAIAGLTESGATGAIALRDGEVAGYLLGGPRGPLWGPNVWVEGAGHAVTEPEIVRDLYGFAAARWVESGATSHYTVVPATDAGLVDAWYRLGFGQQHVHAIREPAGAMETLRLPPGIAIRRAERRDIPTLALLDVELAVHQGRSPVFSSYEPPPMAEAIKEWEDGFDDPACTTFVAEHDRAVIGSAVGCSIEVSSEHRGIVQPANAGFLGFAAVLPEARGLGAGRALGEAVILWARDAGYPSVAIDWRETNLLSSRTWPRLGFRPTFRRLHRAIA